MVAASGAGRERGFAIEGVRELAIDPQNPATVYAGTGGDDALSGGVFKSTDGAQTWRAVNAGGLPAVFVGGLAIDPQTPATVYVGIGLGVFRSTDGGGTWRPFNRGLTNHGFTDHLAISSTGRVLYAGTEGGGVLDYTFPG